MTKVLVIEDDKRTQNLYRAALGFQGITVITSDNASQGFKYVESKNPDLIILDIMLPTSDGLNLIKKLKERGKNYPLPVIILSDLKDESIRKEASILGACEYLVKSENSIGDIIGKVRKLLNIKFGEGAKPKK